MDKDSQEIRRHHKSRLVSYEHSSNIAPSVKVGEHAQGALHMLRVTDQGDGISQLQSLFRTGHDFVYDNFGQATDAAVRACQASQCPVVDGIADPATWRAPMDASG